jgi:hypothetical protein
MKALVYRGPGLKAIEDRPKPDAQPRDGDQEGVEAAGKRYAERYGSS